MDTFIETIKIQDGQWLNLPYHVERVRETSRAIFGQSTSWDMSRLEVPEGMSCAGVVKCRVVYDREIREVTFQPYRFRQIERLQLVASDGVDYRFKSTDRSGFARLLEQRGTCDDILIVREGLITDTSFSNVVFEDETGRYTPSTFLLNGTCRQRLLDEGVARERVISVDDVWCYRRVYLVNAMMDVTDGVMLPVSGIIPNSSFPVK